MSGTDAEVSDDQTGRGARIQGSEVPQRRVGVHSGKTGVKPTSFQAIVFSDTDELVLPEGFRYELIRSSGDPLGGGLTCGDHNDYVAYLPIDALEGSEASEDGIQPRVHKPHVLVRLHRPRESDQEDQGADSAGESRGMARVKSILAASTRQDWEADGPRLWVHKGDKELRIVDLTDDEGRVELKEEWARSAAGAGSVALRMELSICQGSQLLAKVPAVCVDSGRAFIPLPREEEDGRLVVTRWHYDLCKVISPGEYLGAHPVRSYLRRAGIVVI